MKKSKKIVVCLVVIILICVFYKLISIQKKDKIIEENKNFEILYTQNNSKLENVVNKNNSDTYKYNVYTYGGSVLIKDDNAEYEFKEAIEKNIITIDEILNKAKEDSQNQICTEEIYYDGGSLQYRYSDYTILKYHERNGNEDIVIGMKRWNYGKSR